MPDNNRYVIAMGGHYQVNKALGLDLGWNHVFMPKAHISPPFAGIAIPIHLTYVAPVFCRSYAVTEVYKEYHGDSDNSCSHIINSETLHAYYFLLLQLLF